MKHNCTYCEYRHGGCNYEGTLDNCEGFTEGKCLSCKLNGTNDECISHQQSFDYVGCDKYIPNE